VRVRSKHTTLGVEKTLSLETQSSSLGIFREVLPLRRSPQEVMKHGCSFPCSASNQVKRSGQHLTAIDVHEDRLRAGKVKERKPLQTSVVFPNFRCRQLASSRARGEQVRNIILGSPGRLSRERKGRQRKKSGSKAQEEHRSTPTRRRHGNL